MYRLIDSASPGRVAANRSIVSAECCVRRQPVSPLTHIALGSEQSPTLRIFSPHEESVTVCSGTQAVRVSVGFKEIIEIFDYGKIANGVFDDRSERLPFAVIAATRLWIIWSGKAFEMPKN